MLRGRDLLELSLATKELAGILFIYLFILVGRAHLPGWPGASRHHFWLSPSDWLELSPSDWLLAPPRVTCGPNPVTLLQSVPSASPVLVGALGQHWSFSKTTPPPARPCGYPQLGLESLQSSPQSCRFWQVLSPNSVAPYKTTPSPPVLARHLSGTGIPPKWLLPRVWAYISEYLQAVVTKPYSQL